MRLFYSQLINIKRTLMTTKSIQQSKQMIHTYILVGNALYF